MEKKELLKSIILAKMEIKSMLEGYRMLAELRSENNERQINQLLDRLNKLEELEKLLEKK